MKENDIIIMVVNQKGCILSLIISLVGLKELPIGIDQPWVAKWVVFVVVRLRTITYILGD